MDKLKQRVLEVAILYYQENLTQQVIAQKLGITRQTVSKLLKFAVDDGVVEIKINDPEKQTQLLEERLSQKLGVTVKVGVGTNSDDLLRKIATVREACSYLNDNICTGDKKIGVAWGRTVQEVIAQMKRIKTIGNIVYPLVGATNRDEGCYYTNKLVSDFAEKTGALAKYSMFPNYVSKSDLELIKQTQIYSEIQDLWANTDIALVGIGNVKTVNDLRINFDKEIVEVDFVGDIVMHVFDKGGKVLSTNQDSLCVSFDDIKRAKNTVAVAYGNSKVEAMICACKTGAINTLITDEYTAKEIDELI